jgi:glycosyltransferase XagB
MVHGGRADFARNIGFGAQSQDQAEPGQPDVLAWLIRDFGFLGVTAHDIEALLDAHFFAQKWGVPFVAALFAGERITQDRYVAAFARAVGLPVGHSDFCLAPGTARRSGFQETRTIITPIEGEWRGASVMLVCATDAAPGIVSSRIAQAETFGRPIVLVSMRGLHAAYERARAAAHLSAATHGLRRRLPTFSAAREASPWQTNGLAMLIGFLIGGLVAFPPGTMALVIMLLTIPFFGAVFVRVVALVGLFRSPNADEALRRRVPDHELPVYSIMVALFDEAQVLPRLIAALSMLDYPAAKLDCLLVIEDIDAATKLALLNLQLPSFMRVVIVPEGQPQTKPRALNYALHLTRGDYVVVYDAEDRPEPDQLRRVLDAFAVRGPKTACVQSCLNIFNARQSWLTRQFTVEYSALFDSILPALQWMRLPMPLGGTSNHFPRAVLAEMHGWDPYNVTEDADLGIRIARLGYDVATIRSTTWEEAPSTFRLWRNQRTRWIKGWMQTYLVHTRQPLAMLRDLGFWRTLGFHLYMGGLILSALVHPLFYVAIAADAAFDLHSDAFHDLLGPLFWIIAIGNLVAGYATAIVVGVVAVRRRGHPLTLSALMMPLYWLLISAAAYRALWQLWRDPFRWEKTPHGLAEEDEE